MIEFIFITVYSILWVSINAYFNKEFIQDRDFHLEQAIQVLIMALGVSTALYLDVTNPEVILYGTILNMRIVP